MSKEILQLNEQVIKTELKELVRQSSLAWISKNFISRNKYYCRRWKAMHRYPALIPGRNGMCKLSLINIPREISKKKAKD